MKRSNMTRLAFKASTSLIMATLPTSLLGQMPSPYPTTPGASPSYNCGGITFDVALAPGGCETHIDLRLGGEVTNCFSGTFLSRGLVRFSKNETALKSIEQRRTSVKIFDCGHEGKLTSFGSFLIHIETPGIGIQVDDRLKVSYSNYTTTDYTSLDFKGIVLTTSTSTSKFDSMTFEDPQLSYSRYRTDTDFKCDGSVKNYYANQGNSSDDVNATAHFVEKSQNTMMNLPTTAFTSQIEGCEKAPNCTAHLSRILSSPNYGADKFIANWQSEYTGYQLPLAFIVSDGFKSTRKSFGSGYPTQDADLKTLKPGPASRIYSGYWNYSYSPLTQTTNGYVVAQQFGNNARSYLDLKVLKLELKSYSPIKITACQGL